MNLNDIGSGSPDHLTHDSLLSGAILPVQFHSERRGSSEDEAVKRLMFAILMDAVRCFQTNLNARAMAKRRMFWEAKYWIFEEKGNGPFSFENVCGALEIGPGQLRRWLRQWRRKKNGEEEAHLIRRTPIRSSRKIESRMLRKRTA